MFSYYGSKSMIIGCYPPPKYGQIIEPFAGSARYALRYWDRDVLLVDKYEVVVKIWKWLQGCSKKDILNLPKLKKGQDIRQFNLSEEETLFLGIMAGVASKSPRYKVSAFSAEQNGRKNRMKIIADNLEKIRHWQIIQGCYSEISDQTATWFIDPPYQFGGSGYVHSKIDYQELARWIKSRTGQVIVCENTKADWLPFLPLKKNHGAMSITTECIYTNFPTSFGNHTISLFNDAAQ